MPYKFLDCNFVYTTNRVVKIPNKCLFITHKLICLFVIFYIGVYGLWINKGYQGTSGIESVVVSKVKGVVTTKQYSDAELDVSNPDFYRRIWDASDIVVLSQGDDSGGFIIVTNLVITANQTRGICPESTVVDKSICKTNADCVLGKILPIGNGPMSGKCVTSTPISIGKVVSPTKTCEIFAWCPTEIDKIPLSKVNKALLEATKDFTVLVKNSIEFPTFGSAYKRRNIMDTATPEYLQSCIYNPKTDPFCPTFKIGDIVTGSGYKYEDVAKTGGVFALKIAWFCSFDFGATINSCRPRYSFSRLDNPNAYVSPGFNFRSTVYHEENRRTLTRNYGIKIVIDVEGVGKKFDSIRLILAIGAGMGLFAIASSICDFLLKSFCKLKRRFKWRFLECFTPDMKYDLTYMKCTQEEEEKDAHVSKHNHELEDIKTMQ